jgi:hypothetical protein
MPPSVAYAGRRLTYELTFKHDFFAATGLYLDETGAPQVVKIARETSLLGIPLGWIGRLLNSREVAMLRRVQPLRERGLAIPRFLGLIGGTGHAREFVPGHPLERREAAPDGFFESLENLVREIHKQNLAYVDLNKRQNILVGDDARPYLIDFQISFFASPAMQRWFPPARWLLARLQAADHYHLLKHKRRSRPDLLTDAQRRAVERPGALIRAYRWISRPVIKARRWVLGRFGKADETQVPGSTAK